MSQVSLLSGIMVFLLANSDDFVVPPLDDSEKREPGQLCSHVPADTAKPHSGIKLLTKCQLAGPRWAVRTQAELVRSSSHISRRFMI